MTWRRLPEPKLPAIDQTYNIIVTGVGGTGIVTVGGILGMAAHLEGRGIGVLDMAGLAQKGGAVFSHIRIAQTPEDIHAIRVAAGRADLVLGGDIVVAGTRKVLAAVKHGLTAMVVNTAEFLPGEFTRNADFSLPSERLKRTIVADAGRDRTHFIDATKHRHRAVRPIRSAPTCSWSATPISSARSRCRPRPSSRRSRSTARRSR